MKFSHFALIAGLTTGLNLSADAQQADPNSVNSPVSASSSASPHRAHRERVRRRERHGERERERERENNGGLTKERNSDARARTEWGLEPSNVANNEPTAPILRADRRRGPKSSTTSRPSRTP